MKNKYLIFCCFFFLLPALLLRNGVAKVSIESCTTSQACQAFIAYKLHDNLTVNTISRLFGVDISQFLGANNFDLSISHPYNVVIPSPKLLRIPLSCQCINGIRQANSTLYPVQTGDTLSKIAGYYGNLVTSEQIANANNILDPNSIVVNQALVIPLHCACHNGNDQGQPSYFLSYQVQAGDTLQTIAKTYNTSVSDLQDLNGLSNFSYLQAQDIIDVPLPACISSFSQSALDYGLAVARGSYAITAGKCIQCSCTNSSTELYCSRTPESFSGTCFNLTCLNSNLTIGEFSTDNSSNGCIVSTCMYNGFSNTTIWTRMKTFLDPKCPASPPEDFYKPPSGVAASPLSEPEAGGSTPPPTSHSAPSAVIPTASSPVGQSSASPMENSLLMLSGSCFLMALYLMHG